jgi:hypothetical protein
MKRTDYVQLGVARVLLVAGPGCTAEVSADATDNGTSSVVSMENGLPAINGLTATNGLNIANGLTTTNGITLFNGLPAVNGLATTNGVALFNGLSVDCTNGVPGESCTGVVDGLLSPVTGLLRNDVGKLTAAYLVKCALPEGDAIKLKDYTGALVTLVGALGLTPEWRTGLCGEACQEKISACLMALTNGSGAHVDIELRSTDAAIGQGGSYRYQEGAFYGNMFVSPPTATYCVGKDFAGLLGTNILSPQRRACEFWLFMGLDCPFKLAGNCTRGWGFPFSFGRAACAFNGDSATVCSSANGNPFSNYNNGDRRHDNVITTYRNSKM